MARLAWMNGGSKRVGSHSGTWIRARPSRRSFCSSPVDPCVRLPLCLVRHRSDIQLRCAKENHDVTIALVEIKSLGKDLSAEPHAYYSLLTESEFDLGLLLAHLWPSNHSLSRPHTLLQWRRSPPLVSPAHKQLIAVEDLTASRRRSQHSMSFAGPASWSWYR